MAREIHGFNSAHRESQEKILRVGFAAKLIFVEILMISANFSY
jgi:hypothetical protein